VTAPWAPVAARIRSLSGRERRLLLLCAAAVALFFLYRRVVDPAVAAWRRDRAAIPLRLEEVSRGRLAAEGAPRIEERIREARKRLAVLEKGLVPGDSPTAASVNLQRMIKPWTDRPDTRLVSVRSLPPEEKGGYASIALQVELQTTVEGLASVLARVPRSGRLLAVKKMSVTGTGAGMLSGSAPRRELLVATIVLSGLARGASPEGAPEAPPAAAVPKSTDPARRGNR
jgi:hypothetical protein